MNNRIQELMKQANLQPYFDSQEKDIEKFAELIVRECIDCLKPLSRNHSMVGAARDTIKEHFGVE
jgi:hypothetical protein